MQHLHGWSTQGNNLRHTKNQWEVQLGLALSSRHVVAIQHQCEQHAKHLPGSFTQCWIGLWLHPGSAWVQGCKWLFWLHHARVWSMLQRKIDLQGTEHITQQLHWIREHSAGIWYMEPARGSCFIFMDSILQAWILRCWKQQVWTRLQHSRWKVPQCDHWQVLFLQGVPTRAEGNETVHSQPGYSLCCVCGLPSRYNTDNECICEHCCFHVLAACTHTHTLLTLRACVWAGQYINPATASCNSCNAGKFSSNFLIAEVPVN